MPWTLTFKPYDEATIGDLTATWDAGLNTEFVHTGSVNISDEGSIADFIATANKLRDYSISMAGKDKVAEKVAPYLAEIETRMNK